MKMKEKRSSAQIYQRLMKYALSHWKLFLISVFGYALYAGTQPLFAMVIKHIIDTLGTSEKEGMMYLPLFFVVLFLFRGIGTFLGSYFLARISTNIIHQLRCEIFDHYTRLPIEYFDGNNSGHLISRITFNVGEVARATTNSVRTFVREGFTAIGLLMYLVYVNWQLSLVFLAIVPFVAIMVKHVSKRLKRISKKMQDTVGDITHITSEVVTGQRIVKSFGGESYEIERFKASSLDNRKQHLKLVMTTAIHNPLIQLVISLALAGLMYLALIMMKDAGAGEFVAYLTAAFLLPRPIRQLSDANAEMQKGIAAAESLFEVLDESVEKDEGKYQVKRANGHIKIKNLVFSYDQAKNAALKNINLTVKAGETVALVGSSGGGKSTLVNLIPRFYDYQQGGILLDGVDITEYKLDNLREQIALVTQNITLFNDTVANNIAYGRVAGVSRERIELAAIDAHAMEFINEMPNGLDTEIGENGITLSGGQRQRLALARALLKDAPVLILDEATSALDTKSERYIQEALTKVMKNRTTFVVAHRLSTVEKADKIIVLDKGKIIEEGKHKDLLSKKGAYAKLYEMQFNSSPE